MDTPMTPPIHDARSTPSTLQRGRRMTVALGVVLVVAGLGAIVFPLASSLAVALTVGVVLCAAGAIQMVWAFGHQRGTTIALNLVVALLWLAAGAYLLWRPLEGVFALTILTAACFFTEGVLKAVMALRLRPATGWGWLLFNAAIAALLGAMLFWQLPSSALWALGVLVGINILVSGFTLLMLPGLIDQWMREGSPVARGA